MKKKKIMPIFIMLFIMMLTIGVNASEYWNAYSTIEKSEDSGELYNLMPTEVKKGDVISVKVIVKDAKGWKISYIGNNLQWDSHAFEIVETDGKYYRLLQDNYSCNSTITDDGSLYYICNLDNFVALSDSEEFIEFKFKVKKDVSDGVYKIYQRYNESGLQLIVGDEWKDVGSYWTDLYYQVGKTKIVSDYTKDKIGNSTYIIGNHMFTRDGSDEYNGVLTTDYIMLASKSIESDDKKDMIVYAKNARGNWINAITDESITPPDEFKIAFQNMKGTYQENGIYSDTGDKNILRFVQLSKDKAAITIENDKEKVNGIATVSGNVATLNVNGKSYKITISENEVNIETKDEYIGNKKLQKRANYSISNLYDNLVGLMYAESYPKMYINSGHSGKYTKGNYELYIARITDDAARMCIKEKGKKECIYNTVMWGNKEGWYLNGEETTYGFSSDETEYGVNWLTDKLEVKCSGACTGNPYVGTFKKEKSLTMEEAIEAWMNNERYYKVIFNPDSDEYDYMDYEYVLEGKTLDYYGWEPSKTDHEFLGWYLNNKKFDFDTPITKPITLVAKYVKVPDTPVFREHSLTAHYHDGYYMTNVSIDYNAYSSSEADGYEIYIKNGYYYNRYSETVNGQLPVETILNKTRLLDVEFGKITTFVARAFKTVDGNRYYSDYSNELVFDLSSLETPTLSCEFVSRGSYKCDISNKDDYLIGYHYIDGEKISDYKAQKYEVYQNVNGEYMLYGEALVGNEITLTNIASEKLLARVYTENPNEIKIFSGYSDEVSLVSPKYTVTFDSQGGSNIANQVVYAGETVTRPTDPTKDGYIFLEWNDFDGTYDFSKPVTDDVYLHAVWTVPTPVLSPAVESNVGHFTYKFSLANIDDYCLETCKNDGTDEYTFKGYRIYEKKGNGYEERGSFSASHLADNNGYISINQNINTEKTYVIKLMLIDSDKDKYSYSNEVVVNTSLQIDDTITSPVIDYIDNNLININSKREKLLVNTISNANYDEYRTTLKNDIQLHRNPLCQDNNYSSECYIVDGYDLFIKDGSNIVFNSTMSKDNEYPIVGAIGSTVNKYVVRAYKLDSNNQRIYSPESNEITIDLTNPTYTFETLDLESDSSKVIVRAYINDYEVYFSQVNIEGDTTNYTDEGGSLEFTMSKSVIENVNTITLKLSDTKSVVATRKN